MTSKILFRGKVSGTNTSLGAGQAELLDVATVPAGKTWIVREVLLKGYGGTASVRIDLYLLKSGGTDRVTTGDTTDRLAIASSLNDAVPYTENITVTTPSGNNTALQVDPRYTVLNDGDKIKLDIFNTAGTVNVTTMGADLQISGEEI
jgi:hypothetical protein